MLNNPSGGSQGPSPARQNTAAFPAYDPADCIERAPGKVDEVALFAKKQKIMALIAADDGGTLLWSHEIYIGRVTHVIKTALVVQGPWGYAAFNEGVEPSIDTMIGYSVPKTFLARPTPSRTIEDRIAAFGVIKSGGENGDEEGPVPDLARPTAAESIAAMAASITNTGMSAGHRTAHELADARF